MVQRKWWIGGLVVVLAVGTWGGYRYFKKEDKQLAASYNTTQVQKGTLEVKISGTGSIQPLARETLKATAAGTALKVNYKQGDTVKKGDVLITYEQEDIADQVRSKEINVEKMKLDLTDLQTKYKTAADDTARESIAVSIQKQQLDIETAQADIISLKTSKSIDPIIAPIDGVLSTFDVKAGDSLNPNVDLGEVVNFSQLQMVVGIDELDIPKVKLAQEAQILVEALPKDTYTGKVIAIADEGTTTNGVATFDVTINLTTTTNLKVGMSAEASILTQQKTDALYVPVAAVQSFQGKYFVTVPSTGTGTGANSRPNGSKAPGGNTGTAPQGGQGQGVQGQGGQGQGGQGQGGQGQGGQGQGFLNMTPEQRAAMRAQRGAGGGGTGGANGGTGTTTVAASTTRIPVEVGINNEDNIEIVSGLKEGDLVILPTVMSAGSKSNTQQGGIPGLTGSVIPGGGGGGFPGGGGGGGGRPGGGGG
jgi:HlyD family secretion protein